MLEINRIIPQRSAEQDSSDSSLQNIATFLQNIIRRNRAIFIVVTILCCIASGFYLYKAKPSYTATAALVVDTKHTQLFQQPGGGGDDTVDPGTIQTQVELIKSQNVSLAVIRNLHLDSDPEFISPDPGFLRTLLGYLTIPFLKHNESIPKDDLQQQAFGVFANDETVSRLGQTYVMEVSFKSFNADKAALIANAIADAYIKDQLDSQYQSTLRASNWLERRIKDMRSQTISADQAVVDFKKSNNIVGFGGKLINEQALGEVNTQLIVAEAATAQAKAKLDRITEVLKQPIQKASVADAIASPIIISLRTKYLELSGREAIFAAKYGVNHEVTIGLRKEMMELSNNISDEMRDIAASADSDYRIALAREKSLQQSLSKSVSNSQATNQAQVTLRNLESTSTSYNSMYDVLMQRYMQTVQQQSFPVSEARLIGPASPPGAPSHPKKAVVFAGTLVSAVLLGFGLALTKEHFNQVFRSSQQVSDHLGTRCVAMVPFVRSNLLVPYRSPQAPLKAGEFQIDRLMLRYATDAPLSHYAEALRSAKISIDLSLPTKKAKVLGLTSSVPSEGKSTLAVNLAQTIAQSGNRVLLVDCDLRNSTLTHELTLGSTFGLLEASRSIEDYREHIWYDPSLNLSFLPVDTGAEHINPRSQILGSDEVAALFDLLRDHFDYIIVDCPPLSPIADARMTIRFVDAYIYVVAWGQTKIEVVDQTFREAPEIFDRVAGVILNKVNVNVLGRYEVHRSAAYHRTYFAKYGIQS